MLGFLEIELIEVQPVVVGIELQGLAQSTSAVEHRLQVNIVALAARDQPSRGVADDVEVRVLHGLEHPSGDVLPEPGMDGGHNDIQFSQQLIGKVE